MAASYVAVRGLSYGQCNQGEKSWIAAFAQFDLAQRRAHKPEIFKWVVSLLPEEA